MVWKTCLLLLLGLAFLQGIRSEYVYYIRGDVVSTGNNYRPDDCSPDHDVHECEEFHLYTYKPQDPGYLVVGYKKSGDTWWVSTRNPSLASSIRIEPGDQEHDMYLIKQDAYY
ncbi:hypothetical protein BGX33_001987 [Mortierella sp. NVP41]|nr:hypothetical protein BGX33_001987 [Mortierella sp. NVP41]